MISHRSAQANHALLPDLGMRKFNISSTSIVIIYMNAVFHSTLPTGMFKWSNVENFPDDTV